jgi:hypothetical protein
MVYSNERERKVLYDLLKHDGSPRFEHIFTSRTQILRTLPQPSFSQSTPRIPTETFSRKEIARRLLWAAYLLQKTYFYPFQPHFVTASGPIAVDTFDHEIVNLCAETRCTDVLTHPERAAFLWGNRLNPIVPNSFAKRWTRAAIWEFLLGEPRGFEPHSTPISPHRHVGADPRIASPPLIGGAINPQEAKEICQTYEVPFPKTFIPQRLENSILPPPLEKGVPDLHQDERTYPGLPKPVNGLMKFLTDLEYLTIDSPPDDPLYKFGVYRLIQRSRIPPT